MVFFFFVSQWQKRNQVNDKTINWKKYTNHVNDISHSKYMWSPIENNEERGLKFEITSFCLEGETV